MNRYQVKATISFFTSTKTPKEAENRFYTFMREINKKLPAWEVVGLEGTKKPISVKRMAF